MGFLAQYGLFALKAFTLVIAIIILVAGVLSLGRQPKPKLTITSLNKESEDIKQQMHTDVFGKKLKKQKKTKEVKPALYVIDFVGDIKASQVDQLRDEISAILSIARAKSSSTSNSTNNTSHSNTKLLFNNLLRDT